MSQKIKKLTAKQEAFFPIYRNMWLEIGLSTEPLDMEKAKAAVCLSYSLTGLAAPTEFYHAKSPADAISIIKKLDPSRSEKDILSEMSYGNHDANWLAFYDYFRSVVGVKESHRLDGLIELAKHCGWLNMYDNMVVFQDRPELIKFDDQNRLHCEDGPAIRYRDGFSIYSWHGVQVPREWLEDKGSLSPIIALTVSNIERRRAACEILGWASILRQLDVTVIDCDEDSMIGTLIEVTIPDIGREKFLKVICGTGREFAIPVPPNMKSALEANAWTYGLDPWEYNPEIRT